MRLKQVNPAHQLVIPTIAPQDAFGGWLYRDSFEGASGFWERDCATQCIMHLVNPDYGEFDYETVAGILHEKKQWEDTAKQWSFVQKVEWMMHHLAPTTVTILETLEELTGELWDLLPIGEEFTLREFAWEYRYIPHMAVSTKKHITAVKDGVIYDFWDSTRRRVEAVMLPYYRDDTE